MNRNASRGVALITALLVVAVAVLAATALLTSSHIALRRTAALRDTEQGWWLARGVESWVVEIIKQDNPSYDALDKDNAWSQPVDYLPVDQGFVHGRVVDQQGLFNLNNLDRNLASEQEDVYGGQFNRLLVKLSEQYDLKGDTSELLPAIRDWMDGDQMPTFPGFEDAEYLSLDPAYRAANRPFVSISELRAVHGMTPALYTALTTGCPLGDGAPPQSCVSALLRDSDGGTKVNVNTASRLVLESLVEEPDESRLEAFLSERVDNPATTAAAFTTREIYKQYEPKIAKCYDVKTEYFQIRGEIVVGSSRVPLYSLIRRKPTPTVIAHSAAED